MKLSIITVNLNNREGLQRTIDSVIGQTFRDFEWIVIDGGSTDGSRELIEQYADHIAYWVSEPDKGIYNAMNKGIKVAKGEYLQFLNSGDWIVERTTLERCFSQRFTADVMYGDQYFVYPKGKQSSDFPKMLTFKFLLYDSLGHSATFIRRNLFELALYDESLRIVSDWAFFVKMMLSNKEFVKVNEIVTCYDTTGISSTNNKLQTQEREYVIEKFVPEAIVQDYRRMVELDKNWGDLLNNNHVRKVLEYGGKKRTYHKLITFFFMLIGLFDKLLSHNNK